MDYNKIRFKFNEKKELLEKINIFSDEYYKILHNIILLPILADLEYKKMIQLIKNEYINCIIKMNKNEREEKVKNMIYNYVEMELTEKERYDILRKEIIDYLIAKQYLILIDNNNYTPQTEFLKNEKFKNEHYELLRDI